MEISNHGAVSDLVKSMPGIIDIGPTETINRIIRLNSGLQEFWSTPEGWAPIQASQLLSRSRLDRQTSLSHSLKLWDENADYYSKSTFEGLLILGWANLGSLVEGSLKLFLSAWYEDYLNDVNAIKKQGDIQDPSGITLEPIRNFFKKRIWDDIFDSHVNTIQIRRNSIHSYQDKEIGDFSEFKQSLGHYLDILRYINFRLPYPDSDYIPREE